MWFLHTTTTTNYPPTSQSSLICDILTGEQGWITILSKTVVSWRTRWLCSVLLKYHCRPFNTCLWCWGQTGSDPFYFLRSNWEQSKQVVCKLLTPHYFPRDGRSRPHYWRAEQVSNRFRSSPAPAPAPRNFQGTSENLQALLISGEFHSIKHILVWVPFSSASLIFPKVSSSWL